MEGGRPSLPTAYACDRHQPHYPGVHGRRLRGELLDGRAGRTGHSFPVPLLLLSVLRFVGNGCDGNSVLFLQTTPGVQRRKVQFSDEFLFVVR